MTFETTTSTRGMVTYFIDGIRVSQAVFDTLFPSKLFPAETGLTEAEARAVLGRMIPAAPPPRTTPHLSRAITGAKPLKSEALAVHRKQIAAVKARNKRHGINVDYDRLGRPVFTDAGQRRALMKLEGVRQMNSAYGA